MPFWIQVLVRRTVLGAGGWFLETCIIGIDCEMFCSLCVWLLPTFTHWSLLIVMYLVAASELKEIETVMPIARINIAIFDRDLSSDCVDFLAYLWFALFLPFLSYNRLNARDKSVTVSIATSSVCTDDKQQPEQGFAGQFYWIFYVFIWWEAL